MVVKMEVEVLYIIRDNTGNVKTTDKNELERLAKSIEYAVLDVAFTVKEAKRLMEQYSKM